MVIGRYMMRCHKLFFWSLARDGEIWKDLLTDTDGQYMEFQTGRMFNQYSPSHGLKTPITQVPFAPGLTDRWNELWFPVKEIGGMVDVSPFGVMNIESENGKLEVGINALAFAQAKLLVKSEGKVILSEDIKLKPMEVYKTSLLLEEGTDYDVEVEGMDLRYNPAKRRLIKRPFHSTMPTNLTTAASIYQEGMELKENRDYKGAKALFKECLAKDPLYIDAMVSLTEIYYRGIQYDSALYYANNALQLDTYNPAANYFAGITYKAQGDMINALESMGWAARSPQYRSTAYAIMASIELQLGNNDMTEHYANLALDYDRNNFNALKVLVVLADNYIQTISILDPLSHFADFERNLLHPSSENYALFTSSITNAIKMIEKSKEWPENLGVGKPYVVDIRIQDYLKAFCLEKINRVDEAATLRKSVVDYTNEYYMAPSFNHILAYWSLREKGETKAAATLIDKIGESDSKANPMQQWVIAKSKNDRSALIDLGRRFEKNTKFLILNKLAEVVDK